MTQPTIAFIGAGNMARSIIKGLIANDVSPKHILVSDIDAKNLQHLHTATHVHTAESNNQAVANADLVVLAVKPQVMQQVATSLANTLRQKKPLVISIAAGITTHHLNQWLGSDIAIVRCMPNTPALLQQGATALYANALVSKVQHKQADQLMRAVGVAVWVDNETQLDAVTAISGSGPAYFFLIMETLQAIGEQWGLAPETAKQLVLQTALGSARMALDSEVNLTQLRRQVTSPGGTTEAALNSFADSDLHAVFAKALTAARNRARELAK